MVDTITAAERSATMSRVRSKNTSPERRVRKAAHAMGLRFRLHRKDLPGCPDLVFPRFRLVLFVHGCFWHRHPGCAHTRTPKSRVSFWEKKFGNNVRRDTEVVSQLMDRGWRVEVIWECETRRENTLKAALRRAIGEAAPLE